ncbi:MAG: response regulator [Magnetococcales bacterium]|nr:response regulator [Magnetococcales bacterium]
MSVNAKLLWIALLVTGLFLLLSGAAQVYVIYPSFEQLDLAEAKTNGERSVQALRREIHHLSVLAQDWSNWDDTYRFIEDRNPEFLASNLLPGFSDPLHIDMLFLYDQRGTLVWGHRFEDGKKELFPWPTFPTQRRDHPLLQGMRPDPPGVTGILLTDRGPMLMAAHPILTSERQGPARGMLIMGRMLDAKMLKTLEEQVGVAFRIWEPGWEPTPAERDIKAELMQTGNREPRIVVEEHWIRYYTLLQDVEKHWELLLRADTPRDIAVQGRKAILAGLLFQGLAALFVMLVMLLLLRAKVLKPLASLTNAIAGDGRRDEFDILGNYKLTLENAIAERTRELREARDLALEASRAKGEFLATMSHEIRTPMNVILGYGEILEGTSLDEEQRRHLTTIRTAGDTLLGLINDILDLAKVESGRLTLERIPFGLRELVEECLTMFREKAHGKGLSLCGEVNDGIPDRLLGDRVRIKQILVNLLGNAVKFTERGGVSVSVREEVHSERVTVLTLIVADSGIGLPEEKLHTLFDSFTQADASHTRKYGGSGLGLAICVRMAEAMGGVVWAENIPEGGSRFYVTLPFLLDAGLAQMPAKKRAEALQAPVASAKFSVLVVDDVPGNRQVLQAHWEQAGHRVTLAASGREAVDLYFKGHHFDLILMDIQMPEMDGLEATRTIRGLERTRGQQRIPIVAVTAHALVEERARCLEAGCDHCLIKPVRKDQLLSECYHLLQKQAPG